MDLRRWLHLHRDVRSCACFLFDLLLPHIQIGAHEYNVLHHQDYPGKSSVPQTYLRLCGVLYGFLGNTRRREDCALCFRHKLALCNNQNRKTVLYGENICLDL